MIGPDYLVKRCAQYLQWTTYGTGTPCQFALNYAYKKAEEPYEGCDTYWTWWRKMFDGKCDRIFQVLKKNDLGWKTFKAQGGFFTMTDIRGAIGHVPVKYFWKDFASVEDGERKLEKFDDWKQLENPDHTPDTAFAMWLSIELKITPWPCFGFFTQDTTKPKRDFKTPYFIRWAHCKQDGLFDGLEDKLSNYLASSKK